MAYATKLADRPDVVAAGAVAIARQLGLRQRRQAPLIPDPVDFAVSVGIEPDPWQAGVLRSTATRRLLLASRQSGKSTITAVLALHRALYWPGSLILLISPSLRQSGELFRKVTDLLRLVVPVPELIEDNRLSCTLANHSRLVALPGVEATIRGFSAPDLIIEDEAARVDDALHTALRPMLATSGGTLVLLSTPWGQRGHFYDAWEHGGTDWERVKVTALECPRIPSDFLEAERRAMTDLAYLSEYMVQFVDVEDQAFRTSDIDAAIDYTLAPLWGMV